jgi:apolipoprotein N-acyltransferase
MASVTGIWGVSFLLGWTASVANHIWESYGNLKLAKRTVAAFLLASGIILCAGALRSSLPEKRQTVPAAGITVEHPRDYWTEIIDRRVPREEAHLYKTELAELRESLFAASTKAAAGGARIIFWSEGNGVLYEDQEEAFLRQAADFARAHRVYFAPALLVLRYGELNNDNKIVMISPEGEIAFSYTKTKSWYPTDSDGAMRYVDTPYGRITSAVCFDLDFPSFIRQAGRERADIILVPSFDTKAIRPYHTDVGLLRGVENGFSVVRQVNKGTSVAADYHGKILAYQDFFETSERIMQADVPISGKRTLYAILGDWFVYACTAYLAAALLSAAGVSRILRRKLK